MLSARKKPSESPPVNRSLLDEVKGNGTDEVKGNGTDEVKGNGTLIYAEKAGLESGLKSGQARGSSPVGTRNVCDADKLYQPPDPQMGTD